MADHLKNSLSLNADRALFDGQIQGLAVTFYENERPPFGLAGILDWHFQGAISRYLRNGVITGKEGECTYFPLTKNGMTYHLILAGAGHAAAPGQRGQVPASTLHNLQKNLASLKLPKIGVSKSDFGQVAPDYFSKNLKGVSLWIAP